MGGASEFPVYEVPENQGIWLIRADRGRYLQHFRQAGVVALGHLDALGLRATTAPYNPDLKSLAQQLRALEENPRRSASQIASQVNQVERFAREVKVGDLVVTPGAYGTVMIGRVTGNPRIVTNPVIARSETSDEETTMPFVLRRPVRWGPIVRRSLLPIPLSRALRAKQTVSNITEHWRAVHHLVYPAFAKDGQLFVSLRINQQKDVSAFAVAQLTAFLAKLEAFAKLKGLGANVNAATFEQVFGDVEGLVTLTMQAQFASDGDTNFALTPNGQTSSVKFKNVEIQVAPGSKLETAVVALIYVIAASMICVTASSVILGNDKIGTKQIPGVQADAHPAATQAQKDAQAFVAEQWLKKGGAETEQKLKLSQPKFDTKPLEDDSDDEAEPEIEVKEI
ncbi:MAG: hypothetical protein ACM30I_05585 [Gemmatimonas sp.]